MYSPVCPTQVCPTAGAYGWAGLYSPSPYPPPNVDGSNVDISVRVAWETISPAPNARHHRAREGESDTTAAAGPSEVALASDER